MEEAADDAPEDGAATGAVPAALLRPVGAAVLCAVRAVLRAAGVRLWRPDARGRGRRDAGRGVAVAAVVDAEQLRTRVKILYKEGRMLLSV